MSLQSFEETKMQSAGLLQRFIVYMNNSDKLFTVLDETEDETNFIKYASFFYKVSKKFNLAVQAYGIKKWPVCAPPPQYV